MKRQALAIAGVAALTLGMLIPAVAHAEHTHVRVIGNGQCVVIAEDSGEQSVTLPDVVFDNNPNVDISPSSGRNHPLHVLVHQGKPGEVGRIFVKGPADPCDGEYVNQ